MNAVHKDSAAFFGGGGGGLGCTEWERPGTFYVVHGCGNAAASEAHILEKRGRKKKKRTARQQQKKAAQLYLTRVQTAALVRLHR